MSSWVPLPDLAEIVAVFVASHDDRRRLVADAAAQRLTGEWVPLEDSRGHWGAAWREPGTWQPVSFRLIGSPPDREPSEND